MTDTRVRRRHVFFLNGFDPKGASFIHSLYRTQAAAQAKVTGQQYDVGPRVRLADGNASWQVRSVAPGGAETHTEFEYARYDDIVRAHWPRSAWGVLQGALRIYRMLLGAGTGLRKTWRASPRTLVSLAVPVGFWLLALCACLLGAWVAGKAIHWMVGVGVFAVLLWLAYRLEQRFALSWLLRIYQFALDWCEGALPDVEERVEQIARSVHARLQDEAVDEVLLVGFSVGSMLSASVHARVQRMAANAPVAMDKLSMLTLGHCIPLLGLMPRADGFRADLAVLADAPQLNWVDYSSPVDWGSFALVDPLAVCLDRASRRPPRMASPRFHTMFDPATYIQLRKNKRRMHMQYLMAGELPSDYDYFALTAGAARLS